MSASSTTLPPPTEPLPIQSERPPWRHTLIALSVPNFRLFTATNLVAMTAGWMQRIAQDWLVLQLTGSVAQVGITVAASSHRCCSSGSGAGCSSTGSRSAR